MRPPLKPDEAGVLRLGDLDRDGALQEAASRVLGHTRAGLIRGAVLGSAALAAALASPSRSMAATSSTDVDILNYALVLEYLQASFYTEAELAGALSGKSALADRHLGGVERAHVKAIRGALGSAAVKSPSFDFQGTTEAPRAFLKTAVALEDLAVSAYKGQLPLIRSGEVLAAAVSIHSVEARHAAWMRFLFGLVPAASAFDEALPKQSVTKIVDSTRFIASQPRTTTAAKARFTG
jgi:hypothetical protein